MKTCPFCKTQNRDIATFCKSCGKSFSEQKEPETSKREKPETFKQDEEKSLDFDKIEFLLNELENWQKEKLVSEAVYKSLKQKYERKKETLGADKALEEAEAFYKQHNWEWAIYKAEEALKYNPKLAYAHLITGRVYEAKNRLVDAVRHYEEALRIEPYNDEVKELLEETRANIEAREEEEKSWREAQGVPKEEAVPPKLKPMPEEIKPEKPAPPEEEIPPEPEKPAPPSEEAPPEAEREAPSPPSPPAPPQPPPPEKPAFDWIAYFDAFLEKRGLNWWYMVGAFILLAGVIGLITWQWSLLGKYAIFAILFFSTIGMYLVGHLIVKRLRLGGLIIIAVASLLLPMNFFVLNAFKIFGALFDWNYVGIVASFTCGIVYVATTYWLKENYFVYFSSVSFAVLLHFVLQAAGVQYFYYGLFFLPLAGIYMLGAFYFKKIDERKFSLPLFIIANAISAVVLGSTALSPDFFYAQGINNTIVMLLMASVIYFTSAYLFDSNIFVYISSTLLLLFGFFLFYKGKIDWYSHGLYFMLFGCFFLGLAATNQRIKKQRFAESYFILGAVVATVVFLVFFGKGLITGVWENLSKASNQELTATLITTFLGAAIYATVAFFTKRKSLIYLSASIFVYFFFVLLARAHLTFVYYPFFLALILCPLLLGGGGVIERVSKREFAFPLYVVGYSVASLAAIRAIYAYLAYWYLPKVLPAEAISVLSLKGAVSEVRISAMWTMLVLAVIFVLSAYFFRRFLFEYPAVFCGSFFYGVLSSLVVASIHTKVFLIQEKNFGLYFVPFVVLLAFTGYLLKLSGKEKYAGPYLQSSFVIAIGCLLLQFFYSIESFGYSISTTFLVYSVLFAISAYVFRKENLFGTSASKLEVFTYLSTATFGYGFTHLLLIPLEISCSVTGSYMSLAGIVWAIKGYALLKLGQKQWLRPLLISATIISALGAMITLAEVSPLTLVTISLFAILYSLTVVLLEYKTVAYLSPLTFLLFYLDFVASFTIPEARYPLYVGLLAGDLLVFALCFAALAWKFKSRFLSYAASLTLPYAYFTMLSIWVHNTSHPAYYSGGMIVVCPVLMLLGYAVSRTKDKELSEPPYVVGYILSALCVVASVSFYLNLRWLWWFWGLDLRSVVVERNVAIFTTVIGSALYDVSSYAWKRKEFVYPAAIVAAIAYALTGSATFIPALDKVLGIEQNYGLYFVFFVIVVFSIGLGLEHFGKREYGTPLSQASFGLAVLCILGQAHYIANWHFKYSVVATFLLYSFLFAIVAYLRRKEDFKYISVAKAEFFTYLSCVTFIAFFFDLLNVLKIAWAKSFFYAVFVAAAYFGLSQAMLKFKQEKFERPLLVASFVFTLVINLLSLAVLSEHLAVYNVLLATVSFILLVVMAWRKDSHIVLYTSLILYGIANLFFFINIELVGGYGVLTTSVRCGSLGLVALTSGVATIKFRRKEITYYGLAALTHGLYLFLRALGLSVKYYPVYFIPYALLLLVLAYFLRKQDQKVYGEPCLVASLLVALCSIPVPVMMGHREVAIAVIAAYSATYAGVAFAWQSLFFTYFSSILFTFGYLYTIFTWPRPIPWPISGFAVVILGAFWFGLGFLIYKFNSRFGYPLLGLSLVVSAAGILIALAGVSLGHRSSIFAVYAMLVAGALYASEAVALRKQIFGHLSFFSFLVAYYLPLLDHQIKMVDAYLIPLGLYLIALGFIYKKREQMQSFINVFFICGTVTVLGSTFIPSIEQGNPIHAVLLLIESIIFIFAGISFRTKSFLILGTVFLIANGLVQFWKPLTGIHWAVYATFAGIFIIGSGILFERKREELLEKGQQIVETLREWD